LKVDTFPLKSTMAQKAADEQERELEPVSVVAATCVHDDPL